MQFIICTLNVQYSACMSFWVANFVPFLTSTMHEEDWTNNQKNQQGFYALMALALGSMFGSVLIGVVLDRFGPKNAIYCILGVCTVVLSSAIVFNEIHQFSLWAYFISFGWGLQDATLINMLNNLMGFEFKSKVTPFAA